MRAADLEALKTLLNRFADEYPQMAGVAQLRELVARRIGEASQPGLSGAHAEELADLRRAPLGNALFTRDSFEAEYGRPDLVGDPEQVDLAGQDPADRCIFCDAGRFTAETYVTDRPGTFVRFWWCHGCGLGRAVSWGALDASGDRSSPG